MRSGFFLMLFDMQDMDIEILAKVSILMFIMCVIASTVFWIWSEYADMTKPILFWQRKFEDCAYKKNELESQIRLLKAKIEDYEKSKNKASSKDS
jgi:uncharacterized protein YlxW (UPF0749 family)